MSLAKPIFPSLEEFVSANPFSYWEEDGAGGMVSRVARVGIAAPPPDGPGLSVGGQGLRVEGGGEVFVNGLLSISSAGRVFTHGAPSEDKHAASKKYVDDAMGQTSAVAFVKGAQNSGDLLLTGEVGQGIFFGASTSVTLAEGQALRYATGEGGLSFLSTAGEEMMRITPTEGLVVAQGLSIGGGALSLREGVGEGDVVFENGAGEEVLGLHASHVAVRGGVVATFPAAQGGALLAVKQGQAAEATTVLALDGAGALTLSAASVLTLASPLVTTTGDVTLPRTIEEPPTAASVATRAWVEALVASMDTSRWELALDGTSIYNRNAGNVGIGTTAPADRLHVHSAGDAFLRITDGVGGGALRMGVRGVDGAGVVALQGAGDLVFETGGGERARITAGGALLVNASSAVQGEKLRVAGSVVVDGTLTIGGEAAATQPWVQSVVDDLDLSNWGTSAGGEHIYSRGAGNVGIGTALPEAKLHVEDSGASSFLRVTRGGGVGGAEFGVDDQGKAVLRQTHAERGLAVAVAGGGAAPSLYISPEGRVGVGTAAPQRALHVQGGMRVEGPLLVAGSEVATHDWVLLRMTEIDTSNWERLEGGHLASRASGRLGVGTAAPQTTLHVHDPLAAQLRVSSSTGSVTLGVDAQGQATLGSAKALTLAAANNTSLSLLPSGEVGVGGSLTTSGRLVVGGEAGEEGYAVSVAGDLYVSGQVRVGHPYRIDDDNIVATREWVSGIFSSLDTSHWQLVGQQLRNRNAEGVRVQATVGDTALEVEGTMRVSGALLLSHQSGNLLSSHLPSWSCSPAASAVAQDLAAARFLPSAEAFVLRFACAPGEEEAWARQDVAWQDAAYTEGKTFTATGVYRTASQGGVRIQFRDGQGSTLLQSEALGPPPASPAAWSVVVARARAPANTVVVRVGVFVRRSAGEEGQALEAFVSQHTSLVLGGVSGPRPMRKPTVELADGSVITRGRVVVPFDAANPGPRFAVGEEMAIEQDGTAFSVANHAGDLSLVSAVGGLRLDAPTGEVVISSLGGVVVQSAQAGGEASLTLDPEGGAEAYRMRTSPAGALVLSSTSAGDRMRFEADASVRVLDRLHVGSPPAWATGTAPRMSVTAAEAEGEALGLYVPSGGTALSLLREDGAAADFRLPAGASPARMDLFMRDAAAPRQVMTWTADGMVGIGTSSPQATLDVAGDLRVAGRVTLAAGAEAPQENDLVTRAWVETFALDYAEKVHFHALSDIHGLVGALAEKSHVDHGHSIPAVDGLAEALALKAGVEHTHDISHIPKLQERLDELATADHHHNHLYVSLDEAQVVAGSKTFTSTLSLGDVHRQGLLLRGEGYGVGTQEGVMYMRTAGGFAVYRGGVHDPAALSPGEGGQRLMVVTAQGRMGLGGVANPTHTLHVAGTVHATGDVVVPAFPSTASSLTSRSWVEAQLAGRSIASHTHSIGEVEGLSAALDDKADDDHTHTIDDIEGFAEIAASKAEGQHGHSVSDIGGLAQTLAGKAEGTHNHPVEDIDGLTEALSAKASNDHHHNHQYLRLSGDGTPQVVTGEVAFDGGLSFSTSGGARQLISMRDPAAAGSVQGIGIHTGGMYVNTTGSWSVRSALEEVLLHVSGDGRVGVRGAAAAGNDLHVHGSAYISGQLHLAQDPAALTSAVRRSWVEARLAEKAEATHGHPIADIDGLSEMLDGLAQAEHAHSISHINGLADALSLKSASDHLHDERYVRRDVPQTVVPAWTFAAPVTINASLTVGALTVARQGADGPSTLRAPSLAIFAGGEASLTPFDPGLGGALAVAVSPGGQVGVGGVAEASHALTVHGSMSVHGQLLCDADPALPASLARRSWVEALLDTKATDNHGHTTDDIGGLETALQNKADVGHRHAIDTVDGLQEALDGKSDVTHLHDARYLRLLPDAEQQVQGEVTFAGGVQASLLTVSSPLRIAPSAAARVQETTVGQQAEGGAALLFSLREEAGAPSAQDKVEWRSADGTKTFSISPAGVMRSGYDTAFVVDGGGAAIVLAPGGGKVGVGTAAPQDTLHVAGDARLEGDVQVAGALSAAGGLVLGATAVTPLPDDTLRIASAAGAVQVQVGEVVAMHAAANGWVGVGTSAPAAALDVAGAMHATQFLEGGVALQDLYAAFTHGHDVGSVHGLQEALDGKADDPHDHTIQQIHGLQDALDGKSDIDHRHAISGVDGLEDALAAIDQSKWREEAGVLTPHTASSVVVGVTAVLEAARAEAASRPSRVIAAGEEAEAGDLVRLVRHGTASQSEAAAAALDVRSPEAGVARLEVRLRHGTAAAPEATPLAVTSEGRVGVNTLTPEAALDVAGGVRVHGAMAVQGALTVGNAGQDLPFLIAGEDAAVHPALSTTSGGTSLLLSAPQGSIALRSGGVVGLRSLAGGRVVVGPASHAVASPATTLTIAATSPSLSLARFDAGGVQQGAWTIRDAAGELRIHAHEGGDVMRVDAQGRVAIGGGAPSAAYGLSVAGGVAADAFLIGGEDVTTLFAPSTHTHEIAHVNGLQAALDSKAPSTHTHALTDVMADGVTLDVLLSLKADVDHDHHSTYLRLLAPAEQVVSTAVTFSGEVLIAADVDEPSAAVRRQWMETQLAGKSPVGHQHPLTDVSDGVDTLDILLARKSGVEHGHEISDINGLTEALNMRSLTTHDHKIPEIQGLVEALLSKSNVGHHHDALYVKINDNQTVSGLKVFANGIRVLRDPVHQDHLARKAWVDARLTEKADAAHTHGLDDIVQGGVTLSAVLNTKAGINHMHTVEDFPSIVEALGNKATQGHGHGIDKISGLAAALEGKATTTHGHDETYVSLSLPQSVGGVKVFTGTLRVAADPVHQDDVARRAWVDAQLLTKAGVGHGHTIEQLPWLAQWLETLAPAAALHNHGIDDIANLSATLALKAPSTHTHENIEDVVNLRAELDARAPSDHDHDARYLRLGITEDMQTVTGAVTFAHPPRVPPPTQDDDAVPMAWLQSRLNERAEATHTHDTFEDVQGLQAALDDKASITHTHETMADVSGLVEALQGKAAVIHTHRISQVEGLAQELDGKAPLNHTHNEQYLSLAAGGEQIVAGSKVFTGALSVTQDGEAADSVTRREWVLARVAERAELVHTHPIAQVSGLQAALDGKAPSTHGHLISQVDGLQEALNLKAGVGHTHSTLESVLGLVQALSEKAVVDHHHDDTYVSLTGDQNVAGVKSFLDGARITSTAPPAFEDSVVRRDWVEQQLEGKAIQGHDHGIALVYGLQEALDGKAPGDHTHDLADFADVVQTLDGKAPLVHSHVIGDIADLGAALDGKSNTTHHHDDLYISLSGGQTVTGVLTFSNGVNVPLNPATSTSAVSKSWADAQILGRAEVGHPHDIADVYGLQAALDLKAITGHNHDIGHISGLAEALSLKAPSAHEHGIGEVSGLEEALAGKAPTTHHHDLVYVSFGGEQTITGAKTFSSRMSFSGASRQMLDLAPGGAAGVGVQDGGVTYVRGQDAFAIYVGGAHTSNFLSAGVGGAEALVARRYPEGARVGVNGVVAPEHALHVSGSVFATGGFFTDADPTEDDHLTRRAWVDAQLLLKAGVNHTHGISHIHGLQALLATFSDVDHPHEIVEVSGLQQALDGKAPLEHDHSIGDIHGLTAALDARALATHDHDERYVTLVGDQVVAGAKRFQEIAFPDEAGRKVTLRGGVTGEDFSVGVQAGGTYIRSAGSVAFYAGGAHSDAALNPGAGGSVSMVVTSAGRVGVNGVTAPAAELHVGGSVLVEGTMTVGRNPLSGFEVATKDYVDGLVAGRAIAEHEHVIEEIAGLDAALGLKAPTTHTHEIGHVLGLQAALDGKAPLVHDHDVRYVRLAGAAQTVSAPTSFQGGISCAADPTESNHLVRRGWLDAQIAPKAHVSHTHLSSDIAGLDAELAGKAAAVHTHAASSILTVGGETVEDVLAGKAGVDHTHDDTFLALAPTGAQTVQGDVTFTGTATVARLGVGVASPPASAFEVAGGSVRVANGGAGRNQLLLGTAGGAGNMAHVLRTRHSAASRFDNAIDIYLWNQGVDAVDTTAPTLHGMTLAGGRLGLGTTTPAHALHVVAPDAGAVTTVAAFRVASAGASAGLLLGAASAPSRLVAAPSFLAIETPDGLGQPAERVRITSDGRVGIGVVAPQHALDVNGVIHATGEFMCTQDPQTDDSVTRRAWVESRLAEKADAVHTHVPEHVDGLSAALQDLETAIAGKAEGVHMHALSSISGFPAEYTSFQDYLDRHFAEDGHFHTPQSVGIEPTDYAPSNHTHLIEKVEGLTEALAAMAPSVHTHGIDFISGLGDALAGKAASYHVHTVGDIAGLHTKLESLSLDGHKHEVDDITGLQEELDLKSNVGHGHSLNGVSGLEAALDGKAPLDHGHPKEHIAGLQEYVDTRAAVNHTHSVAHMSGMAELVDAFVPQRRATFASTEVLTLASSAPTKCVAYTGTMWITASSDGRIYRATTAAPSAAPSTISGGSFVALVRNHASTATFAVGAGIVVITDVNVTGTLASTTFSGGVRAMCAATLNGQPRYVAVRQSDNVVFIGQDAALPSAPTFTTTNAALPVMAVDVEYGGGTVVVLAERDVMYSHDAVQWHPAEVAPTAYASTGTIPGAMKRVAWSEELHLFLAVGTDVALSSADGQRWTMHTIPPEVDFADVVWCKELMRFVAVASTASAGASTLWSTFSGEVWSPVDGGTHVASCLAWAFDDMLGRCVLTVAPSGTLRVGWYDVRAPLMLNTDPAVTITTSRVGVMEPSPQYELDVNGTVEATEVRLNGVSVRNIFAEAEHTHPPSDITDLDTVAVTLNTAQTIAGNKTFSGNISFGSVGRQMINLWSTTYGIGLQTATAYFRTNGNFAFYRGGTHSNATFNSGSGGQVQMVIQNVSGQPRVGISTITPAYSLDVNGTIRAADDIIASSDARLKTDIRPIAGAVEKVARMRGVTFERVEKDGTLKDGGKRYAGVIAQEVREVLPEAVDEDDDGYLSVAYGSMVGLMIEAVKEIGAMVSRCERVIEERQAWIDDFESYRV